MGNIIHKDRYYPDHYVALLEFPKYMGSFSCQGNYDIYLIPSTDSGFDNKTVVLVHQAHGPSFGSKTVEEIEAEDADLEAPWCCVIGIAGEISALLPLNYLPLPNGVSGDSEEMAF
jgi:hypothetical protein